MSKALFVVLVAGTILAPTATAQALTPEAKKQCLFNSLDPGTWTQHEENRTTWCVLDRWPVPGGISKFHSVGQCESGWYRFANNDGRYLGLFQHAASSWDGRVRTFEPRLWKLKPGWTNSRTQIVVTARMVRAYGWGPWSCA